MPHKMKIAEILDKWIGDDKEMIVEDKTKLESLAVDQKADEYESCQSQ